MFVLACTSAAGLCVSFLDDTQRKSPSDRVKDHGSQALGDWLTSTDIESDQGRNIVKTIVFELEQLPGVALWPQGRNTEEILKLSIQSSIYLYRQLQFNVQERSNFSFTASFFKHTAWVETIGAWNMMFKRFIVL